MQPSNNPQQSPGLVQSSSNNPQVVPLPVPQIVQDLIAFSPFYHFRQLILSAVNLNHDNHLILHFLWLLWACGAFGLLAAWSYQRDRTVQFIPQVFDTMCKRFITPP